SIVIDAPSNIDVKVQSTLPEEFTSRSFVKQKVREMIDEVKHHDYRAIRAAPEAHTTGPSGAKIKIKPPTKLDAGGTVVFRNSFIPLFDQKPKRLPDLTNEQIFRLQHNSLGSVAEPSLAIRGKEILITANWSAFLSSNGGNSFGVLDPLS